MAGKKAKKRARPEINYDGQAALGDVETHIEDLPSYLFALASEVAKRWHKEKRFIGALIVVGNFRRANGCRAPGMRQLGLHNPLEGRFVTADSAEFAEMLYYADGTFGDGAVVIDTTGQVLGASAYVIVDHPEAEIPDEAGSHATLPHLPLRCGTM